MILRGHIHYIVDKVWKPKMITSYLPKDRCESINKIVKEHFEIEDNLRSIVLYAKPSNEEFLFLEVNEEAMPAGAVEPFYFAPSSEFAWPLHLASVTHNEWMKIESSKIALPQGWLSTPIFIFQRDEVLGQ